jgi:hypothetical protein
MGGYVYNTGVAAESGTVLMELTDGSILQYHPGEYLYIILSFVALMSGAGTEDGKVSFNSFGV